MKKYFAIFTLIAMAGCQMLLPDLKIETNDSDTFNPSGLENGENCVNDDDCKSVHCLNGVCCNSGGECCNDQQDGCGIMACNLDIFECYAECGPGGDEHDEYCDEGFHCDENACWDDIFVGGCNENSDCVSDECISGNCCEHAGLCCGGDIDCPEMFYGCSEDDTHTCEFSQFQYPDTGQADECYNGSGDLAPCSTIGIGSDYYGQDGHYPGPGRLYDDSNVDWVVDQITNLSWTVGASVQMSWDAAQDNCQSQTFGFKTWRLPKRYELMSIVDYHSGLTIGVDPVFAMDAATEEVWTGTELGGGEFDTAWAVNFATGGMVRMGKSATHPRVICVSEE